MKNFLMLFISSVIPEPKQSKYKIHNIPDVVITTQTNESAFLELVMHVGEVGKVFVFASHDVRRQYVGMIGEGGDDIVWLNEKTDDVTAIREAFGANDFDGTRLITSLDYFKWLLRDHVLPENIVVCDYDETSDINASLVSINDMAGKIMAAVDESGEEVVLHADMTGGLRNASMMMLGVMRLLEYSNIRLGRVLYSNWAFGRTEPNWVEDAKKVYDFFDLVAGAKEFVRFGSVKEIKEYYSGDVNVGAELSALIEAMESFSENIKLCHYGEFIDCIERLKAAIRSVNSLGEGDAVSESDKLFKILLPTIEKEYGGLLKDDVDDIEIIEWCVDNGYLQQAMTLFTERVPEYVFDAGILAVGAKHVNNFENEYRKYRRTNKGSRNFYAFFNWKPQDPRDFGNKALKSFINSFRRVTRDILKGKIGEDRLAGGVIDDIQSACDANIENVILEFNGRDVTGTLELAHYVKHNNRLPEGFVFDWDAKTGNGLLLRRCFEKMSPDMDIENHELTAADVMAAMKFIANNADDKVYEEAFNVDIRYTDKYHRELRAIIINRLLSRKQFESALADREMLDKIFEDYYLIKDERNSTNHARNAKGESTAERIEGLLKEALKRLRQAKSACRPEPDAD